MTHTPTKLELAAEALVPMTDEQFLIAQHMLDWVMECLEEAAQVEETSPNGRKDLAVAFRLINNNLFGDAGGHPEFCRRYKDLLAETEAWKKRTL